MYFHQKWIHTINKVDHKIQRKTSFIAKIFKEECLDEIQKISPTYEKLCRIYFIIFLMVANSRINPITWQSKKIKRMTRSILASQILTLIGGNYDIFLATLYNDLIHNSVVSIKKMHK